ncbi:MAG: carboxylesterase family protein [Rhizomicrobium sp.]
MAARSTPGRGSVGTYNGKFLVPRGDIVLVTINYRLGRAGLPQFARCFGRAPAGHRRRGGWRDQIMALSWVKKNIAAFGGDPDNVHHLRRERRRDERRRAAGPPPSARGLYHKAIPTIGRQRHRLSARDIGADRQDGAGEARQRRSPPPCPGKRSWDVQKAILEGAARGGRRHALRADHRRHRCCRGARSTACAKARPPAFR